ASVENFDVGATREFVAPLHPEEPSQGTRKVPFSRELYIERDDFREDPPKEWFRLAPGREVRLRYAALITCVDVKKDSRGEVIELRCSWDPQSWGGTSPDGRTVRGTLHWVSAAHAIEADVRLYDRLFAVESPGADENKSFLDELNPKSLERVRAQLEPYLKDAKPGQRFQFERLGYFTVDPDGGFNRTVTLKDTWAKIEKKSKVESPKSKPEKKPEPAVGESTIEDFQRLDLRVGVVKTAELVEGADKLLKLQVDLGEGKPRQIFSGIRASYPDPSA